MRGVARVLGRLALWLVVFAAGFAAAIFLVVLISAEDSNELIGGIALLTGALLIVGAALWGLRKTRRLWPEKDDHSRLLAEARERLEAGEPVVLRASRHRWAGLLVIGIVLTAASGLGFGHGPTVLAVAGVLFFGAATVNAVVGNLNTLSAATMMGAIPVSVSGFSGVLTLVGATSAVIPGNASCLR